MPDTHTLGHCGKPGNVLDIASARLANDVDGSDESSSKAKSMNGHLLAEMALTLTALEAALPPANVDLVPQRRSFISK